MGYVGVCETFVSVQGESSYAGLPCFFVRLAGCNLRCTYCDTPVVYSEGERRSVASIVTEATAASGILVEITGGEPLLQEAFPELAATLRDRSGKTVLVETNGSRDITIIPEGVITIMDIKCPGSGEVNSFDENNLERLRGRDEIKFVLSDRPDYEWARDFTKSKSLEQRCHAVLFSPVPGVLEAGELARWIMADGLPVRLQVQLHKILGMR